jgi:MFS family permease
MTDRNIKNNIKLLAIFNFFTDLKFHSAVLIIYFVKVTGSYTLGMSIFSAVMVSSAIFEVPTGAFSDYIGRKKTIILGALSSVIASLFYALGFSYWWLFVGALFEGLSRSWYSGNNDAFLHDTLTELGKRDYYDYYLGKVSAMFQAALMMGAVLGSIIANWSFSLVMWFSVIPQLTCVVLATKMTEPKIIKKESTNIFSHLHFSAVYLWKNIKLRLLSINSILSFGISESGFQFRGAFINSLWPLWAVGFGKMFSYLFASISYWFSGKVIRKFGAVQLLLFISIYGRIINMISTGIPTIVSPILMSSTSLFHGISDVVSSKLRQQEFTEEQRATMESINSLLGSIFYGIYAIFLGFIGDKLGPAKALFISQLFLLPLVWTNWKLVKLESEN